MQPSDSGSLLHSRGAPRGGLARGALLASTATATMTLFCFPPNLIPIPFQKVAVVRHIPPRHNRGKAAAGEEGADTDCPM